ncbi:hypothetical protein [Loktanella sp. SALINAS62]|uniref:hypothetical protein n=1 Tax=Loktanella sp. SALINAS62 TaxID=2706124 RepID=UPI001B8CE00D|nr:hypothetical protein [Loktanella sp. SALINAS62]MBS1300957.1 hypothetical protein [Loktanella sp. SALINAS62]
MTDRPDLTRRRLLAGVPLASAALSFGTQAQAAGGDAQTSDQPADPRQPRFTTTDRVAEYYRLARR